MDLSLSNSLSTNKTVLALKNLFNPRERFWVKDKILVMKFLRTISLSSLAWWLAFLTAIKLCSTQFPEIAPDLLIAVKWSYNGIIWAIAAAGYSQWMSSKGAWIGKPKRVDFGKRHRKLIKKMRKRPIFFRVLDRLFFGCLALLTLCFIALSIAPRIIVSLLNLGLLG